MNDAFGEEHGTWQWRHGHTLQVWFHYGGAQQATYFHEFRLFDEGEGESFPRRKQTLRGTWTETRHPGMHQVTLKNPQIVPYASR